MKPLVTQYYHALNIRDLARGGHLFPYSRYDWVWRTNKGAHQTTVTITVLTNAFELVFPMYGLAGIHQRVRLTYRSGLEAGSAPGLYAPMSATGGRAVSRGRPALSLSDLLWFGLSLTVCLTKSELRPSVPGIESPGT